jgi:hypothetical protein
MPALASVSLLVNVAVLVPVSYGLLAEAGWAVDAYGPRAPARQILLAVYLAILALSAALLFWRQERMVCGLLLAQIAYKALSPLTVGALWHPVVLSNLGVAALHAVTVYTLLRVPR